MEEDPNEIIQSVYECIERTCEKLVQLSVNISSIKGALKGGHTSTCQPCVNRTRSVDHGVLKGWTFIANDVAFVSAVGVTNQRETTLVWDKETGEPLYRAIGELKSNSNSCHTFYLCHPSLALRRGAVTCCLECFVSAVYEYYCIILVVSCDASVPHPSCPQLSHVLRKRETSLLSDFSFIESLNFGLLLQSPPF